MTIIKFARCCSKSLNNIGQTQFGTKKKYSSSKVSNSKNKKQGQLNISFPEGFEDTPLNKYIFVRPVQVFLQQFQISVVSVRFNGILYGQKSLPVKFTCSFYRKKKLYSLKKELLLFLRVKSIGRFNPKKRLIMKSKVNC